MTRLVKKVAPIALPVLGSIVAPGIGTALGSTLSSGTLAAIGGAAGGAAGGAIGGGGLKGALIGGAGGGIAGGLGGGALGSSLSNAARTGLQGATLGASSSLATGGGLKGALTGAALGGVGGYALGGGSIPGISGSKASLLGTKAGTPLAGGFQGPTQGSGLLGSLTGKTGGLSLGTAGRGLNLLGALQSSSASDDIEEQLLRQQRANQQLLAPYNQQGLRATTAINDAFDSGSLGQAFQPQDLENDPGYQFRLQQGQRAMDRSAAARGSLYSGSTLKAAQEYGQGLADQTYNDAYKRDLLRQSNLYNLLSGQQNVGLNATGAGLGVNDSIGNIQAGNTAQQNNILTSTLAQLLQGNDEYTPGFNPYAIGY